MKVLATIITGLSLLAPFAASAKDVVKMGNVSTSRNLCVGLRLDDVTTYHAFLKEFALDLTAAHKIANDPAYSPATNAERLAVAKAVKYTIASSHVKSGQSALCGAESDNWHD